MTSKQINTIDDVIHVLELIISESENNNSPTGYFAALYRNVTIQVKEGVNNRFFEDGQRMEELDVVFAKRYIDAYYDWQNRKLISKSWQKAFEISGNYWPIVLQHLLLGMNAHISFDLGIAAAEVSKNKKLAELENDFLKINLILASMVNKVQNNLSEMWPTLKKILDKTKNADDMLVDFSMELARDGAWNFACEIVQTPDKDLSNLIKNRDNKIAGKADLIVNPGFIPNLILKIIRLGEKGTIEQRIKMLGRE